MRLFAVPMAIVSTLVLLGGLMAGLVSASDPAQPLPTPTPPPPDERVTETSALVRAALVELYNSTDGPNWWNNANWLSNAPVREWYGVSVDNSGRVVGLHLYENGLSGTIPSELGNLTNLQWLEFSSNQLSGEIPEELGNLTNLGSLGLFSNQLSGEIPEELGNLTNLYGLQLSSNQLSGEIPEELGNLTNLQWLEFSSNQLSGEIPEELGNLTNLYGLQLSSNQLSGEIPEELGNLTNLYGLQLSSNQLSGEIPAELGNLTNLEVLWLSSNRLSGNIPSELGNLANLISLALSGNQLSGNIPLELGNLANLQLLWLSRNQLEGCVPRGLEGVENNDLGSLGLAFCRVPGPPTITALIIAGDNSLTIAWDAPTSGPAVTAYDLRYILADAYERVKGNWTVEEDVWTGTGALRYVLTGLAAGTQYDVQVRAVGANGNGPWSATISGTPMGRVEDEDSLGNRVTDVKVEAIPNSPNTIAKWTVQFLNSDINSYWYDGTDNRDQDDNILNGGTGKDVIMVEFEDDVQFPDALSASEVVITASMAAEADGTVIERTVVANPLGVDITSVAEFDGYAQRLDRPPDETLVTLEIPDMEPADDRPGSQGIAPGATDYGDVPADRRDKEPHRVQIGRGKCGDDSRGGGP